MNVVFWQNIISPHQVDFLTEFSAYKSVTLVVEKAIDSYREKDGWGIPETQLKVIVAPKMTEIEDLLQQPDSVHVFSGIGAYPLVNTAFKKAIKLKAKIGVMSEPVRLYGFKGLLKKARGKFFKLRYNHSISFIAATGDMAVNTYKIFGYPEEKIFQWGYFMNVDYKEQQRRNSLTFVGQLIDRKQILNFLKVYLDKDGFGFDEFNIIGKGPHLESIQEVIENSPKKPTINLLGRLSKQDTMEIMAASKMLVLPSEFDGWGAVVNESLLNGTPVFVSGNVGAKILLASNRGGVFELGDTPPIESFIEDQKLFNDNFSFDDIRNWALLKITAKVSAKYFDDIVNYSFSVKPNDRPIAPWIT